MAQQRFQAGMLDRKVVIQNLTETQSGTGNSVEAYTNQATIWAHRKDETAGSSEDAQNRRVTAVSMVTFTIRYRADISVKSRLVSDGDTFDITHIAPIGRQHLLEIKCQRRD